MFAGEATAPGAAAELRRRTALLALGSEAAGDKCRAGGEEALFIAKAATPNACGLGDFWGGGVLWPASDLRCEFTTELLALDLCDALL